MTILHMPNFEDLQVGRAGLSSDPVLWLSPYFRSTRQQSKPANWDGTAPFEKPPLPRGGFSFFVSPARHRGLREGWGIRFGWCWLAMSLVAADSTLRGVGGPGHVRAGAVDCEALVAGVAALQDL